MPFRTSGRRKNMEHLRKVATSVRVAGLIEVGVDPDSFPDPSVRFAREGGYRRLGDGFITIDDDGFYGIHWFEREDDHTRAITKLVRVPSLEELTAKLCEVCLKGAQALDS